MWQKYKFQHKQEMHCVEQGICPTAELYLLRLTLLS